VGVCLGLHLHRAERADRLVDELANILAGRPADPFAPDVVAVPARGVERWLSQRLSHLLGAHGGNDGVAANVAFPSPARLIAAVTAAASGFGTDDDPWAQGVEWRLLDVIDATVAEPWAAPLCRHLAKDPGRRLALAAHLAGLFGSYGEQRPQLLRDWQAGRDTDGAGAALAPDLCWQAELWRRLRAATGTASPAERLDDVCTRLRDEPAVALLPDRLSLFGPTRLTSDQVAVLGALAERRDMHLWLPHPSAALWERVCEQFVPGPRPRRRGDPTAALSSHPLLTSLGRDVREMQLVLGGRGGTEATSASDQHHRLPDASATLLGRLQSGLRSDQAPPGPPLGDRPDERAPLDPHDHSLQVHACHGRARQVEVLREVLLGLLADDPTLEPRDVLVMCPDIESYAPLISATFGLGDPAGDPPGNQHPSHPGHRLRVRLADRSLRQTNPLLGTVSRLLDLADSRVTASQVLDFAASPPVRRRFHLDDEQLERARGWVGGAGVRWGVDADHRAPYRMEHVPQNTWQAGLDRVLVGVAMAEDELCWLGLALPLDDVDSSDIELAGRVAELVDRLGAALDGLRGERTLDDWLGALGDALDSLTAVGNADAWQRDQAQRQLAGVGAGSLDASGRVGLTLGDIRAALADRLRGRPTRAGFRTGNLTMCSMVPMRSVPHRVVCLLGLDDGVFPRTPGVDGDDILARDPLVGERDRRSEDRQLLLDAILAAQEHLVMLYAGADERTNAVRPPAVPLGEILDVVDATVRATGEGSGASARNQVVVRHPLQPFDERNFSPGALGANGPFSFDVAALSGARVATGTRRPAAGFLDRPLPPPTPGDTVELERLHAFLEHPVRGFLRQRLGVAEPDAGDELDDALHAELDGLAKWPIGDQWLRQRLSGAAVETCRDVEWRRGRLPPGELGRTTLAEVEAQAEPLLAAAAEHRVADPLVCDVSVSLPDGRLLAGTVGSLHRGTLLRTEFSRLGAKHRLRAWVLLLALVASTSETSADSWRAVTIGRGDGGVRMARLTPPDRHQATDLLQSLVSLRDAGLREPLPLPLGASLDYAQVRRRGAPEPGALARIESDWQTGFEGRDAHHAMVWGRPAPFQRVREQAAGDADQPETGERESSRFGALACRLWFPLLELESVGLS